MKRRGPGPSVSPPLVTRNMPSTSTTGSRFFGATISAPPISLSYVFCTDHFGADSVLFDSSLI